MNYTDLLLNMVGGDGGEEALDVGSTATSGWDKVSVCRIMIFPWSLTPVCLTALPRVTLTLQQVD